MIIIRKLLLIILFITVFTTVMSQQYIQTTFTRVGNQVTVKLKSSQTVSGTFSNFAISFRYLESYGINFTVTNSNYSTVSWVQDQIDVVNPLYHNYKFGFTSGASSVTFTQNQEYDVFTFKIVSGLGTGTIGLISDEPDEIWTPAYVFDGFVHDYTNYATPFYGSNVTSFNDGFDTWAYKTLDVNLGKYWLTTGTSNWGTGANWSDNTAPLTTDNISIISGGTQPIAGSGSVCNKLNIETGATVNIPYNGDLTINGDLVIADDNSLVVNSTISGTGSLITNGNVPTGNKVMVQRYLKEWTSVLAVDGWHQISSPVSNQAVAPNFAAAGSANCDFFSWNETTNMWIDVKPNAVATNFSVGSGYMVSYGTDASSVANTFLHYFSGVLNTSDVHLTNLTYSGSNGGYNLLGNPFPSGLIADLNSSSWQRSNVNNYVYTWNNVNGNYLAWSPADNHVIPAMQAFWVKASGASPSITIPAASKRLSTSNVYKSTLTNLLNLNVISSNNYSDKIQIQFSTDATNGFDEMYDAPKLYGAVTEAPQLYSYIGNNKYSINVMGSHPDTSIPLGFESGINGTFTIKANDLNSFDAGSFINLVDLKTGTSQNLMQNDTYTFTANTSDNVNRFILNFNSTSGIGDNNAVSTKIYSYGSDIIVNSPENVKQIAIYNTIGQLIYSVDNHAAGMFKYSLNGTTGYYIVRVITDRNVSSEKVFVK